MGNIRFRLVREYLEPCESNEHLFLTGKEMARTTNDNARMRHIKSCNLYQSQHQRGCEYYTGKRTKNN